MILTFVGISTYPLQITEKVWISEYYLFCNIVYYLNDEKISHREIMGSVKWSEWNYTDKWDSKQTSYKPSHQTIRLLNYYYIQRKMFILRQDYYCHYIIAFACDSTCAYIGYIRHIRHNLTSIIIIVSPCKISKKSVPAV